MNAALSRAVMALAVCCMDEGRREWIAAIRAEFEIAVDDGRPLRFAAGCLAAAWREMLTREQGRFALTSYVLVLGLMMPMAALQLGSALAGLPYLYPGRGGLEGALLIGGDHEPLVRSFYQATVPSLAFLLLITGLAQLSIAWATLDRDWERARRIGTAMLSGAAALIIVMSVVFLDCTQAALQAGVIAIELAVLEIVGRWHAQLFATAIAEHPG